MKRNGVWVRCNCLYREKHARTIASFGAGSDLIKGSPGGDTEVLHRIKNSIRSSENGKVVLVLGSDALIRWRSIALILYELQKDIPSQSVYGADFNALIQSFFNDDEVDRIRVKNSRIVWLRLDFMRKHEWTKPILLDLLCRRNWAITILTSSIDLGKVLNEISVVIETFKIDRVTWNSTS